MRHGQPAVLCGALSVLAALLACSGDDGMASSDAAPGGPDAGADAGDIRVRDAGEMIRCDEPGALRLAWAKRVAAGIGTGSFAVAADGTMRMAGAFMTSNLPATFAPGQAGAVEFTSMLGTYDAWVTKIDAEGEVEWVRTAGSTAHDEATSVAALDDGTTRVAGFFAGTAVFGQDEPGEVEVTTSEQEAMFVAKYEADGALAWVKTAEGPGAAHPYLMLAAADGSIRVFGTLEGVVTFGPGEPAQTMLAAAQSSTDVFMVSFDADGDLSWAKRLHALPSHRVVLLDNGGMVLAGGPSTTETTLAIGEANETQVGPSESFFVEYDADGALGSVSLTSGVAPLDLALGQDGSFTMVGTLFGSSPVSETVTFGENEANETAFTGSTPEFFIARYAADFSLEWVKRAGDPVGQERGLQVGVASDGSARAFGTYSPSTQPILGPGEPGAVRLPGSACAGSRCDIPFLANYAAEGTVIWGKRMSAQAPSVVDLRVLADGSLRIGGGYGTSATFGEGEPGATTLTGGTIYVARYDTCP